MRNEHEKHSFQTHKIAEEEASADREFEALEQAIKP